MNLLLIENEYGLISSFLNIHRKDLNFMEIKLLKIPAKYKELFPPDVIYSGVKGSNIELAVLLTMWLSFSESTICGLTKTESLLKTLNIYVLRK